MSLPNPDYLTNELDNSFTGITYPSVVVENADSTSFTKQLLQWRDYDMFSRQILHYLIMGYAAINGVVEDSALPIPATAPFYVLNFEGELASGELGNPAYRVDRQRTATIETDTGGKQQVTIAATGGTPVSYQDVIDAINAQTDATATHYSNSNNPWHQNILVQGGTANSTGLVRILDRDLFRDLIDFMGFRLFVGVDAAGSGGTANANGGLRGALELNLRSNRPYSEHFEYWPLLEGPPIGSTNDQEQIFYNNKDNQWQFIYNGSAV